MRLRAGELLAGRNILIVLLLCVFIKNLVWIFSFPAFQAPDEDGHFEYARYLAEFRKLPFFEGEGWVSEETALVDRYLERREMILQGRGRQDFSIAEEREQEIKSRRFKEGEGSFEMPINIYIHPPAYYLLLSPFYWLARNTDFFFRFYLLRIVSSLLSLGTVLITYFLGLKLLKKRSLAFGVSLLLAFQPTFSFVSAALNNDNLVYLFYSAVFYLVLTELDRKGDQRGFLERYRNLVWGIVLAVGMLTKANCLPAVLIFVLSVLFGELRKDRKQLFRSLIKRYSPPALLVLLISGWWYFVNIRLYGEPLRGSLSPLPSRLALIKGWDPMLYREKSLWYYVRSIFTDRFRIIRWGILGWFNVSVNKRFLAAALKLLQGGLAAFVIRYLYILISLLRKKKTDFKNFAQASVLLLAVIAYDLFMIVLFLRARLLSGRPNFPNQARYYLPTMPALILLSLWGTKLFRNKIVISLVLCAVVGFMICFNLSSLFNYLIPRYY